MRLLLDSHVLIGAAANRLDRATHALILEEADAVFVSAATVWEIEIKRAAGKLAAPGDVEALVDESGFERLSIDFIHAREAARLPLVHNDPFDRLLIAQARIEGMTLATADAVIPLYDVPIFAARPG